MVDGGNDHRGVEKRRDTMTDKEWEVEASIEIRTSFFCDTKEEAEKEAHNYLSEMEEKMIRGDANESI